jgi:hypothetical protein
VCYRVVSKRVKVRLAISHWLLKLDFHVTLTINLVDLTNKIELAEEFNRIFRGVNIH